MPKVQINKFAKINLLKIIRNPNLILIYVGRFRKAYRGEIIAPSHLKGIGIVSKKMIGQTLMTPNSWDQTIQLTDRARELVKKFNQLHSTDITFTQVHEFTVTAGDGPEVRLGEKLGVEDYIPGYFQKFCNNYGYIRKPCKHGDVMSGFMHWTWIETKGEEIIADLQGVYKENLSYRLTDPAIISLGRYYGVTDTGVEGMVQFFLGHKCNAYCKDLIKPETSHFAKIIRAHVLSQIDRLKAQVGPRTSYARELQFPSKVGIQMVARFREIARNLN